MTFNWKLILFAVMTLMLAIAIVIASHYRSALTESQASLTKVNRELNLAKDTIKDMETRQRDVAALDAKYTKELADAQSTINQLERDVATGKRRLQLNATCTANGTTSTAGVDDAATARLTDAAQRDYFTLRERIETVTKQLTGLQAYVHEQCIK
ncbi:lysis protein [Cronobacter turicensis]|nr:lysis protein [Cronobacter turicensis]EMA1790090.1 lysis protein [Cronobacter turicensis]EMA1800154.1 lysis protein [Cronobacter turicensis]EMA1847367.1 lysis protein [Cronobacter turicensis]EMA1857612.1 lysis protein [Cronobacter turicensis]